MAMDKSNFLGLFLTVVFAIVLFVPVAYSIFTHQNETYPDRYICPVTMIPSRPIARAVCFQLPRIPDMIGAGPSPTECEFGSRGNQTDSFPGGFEANDFENNVTPVSQYNDTRGWGNNSCYPAAAASIIEFLNRTRLPGIMNQFSIDDLVDALRNRFGTDENGTENIRGLLGLIIYINEHNFTRNVTMGFYFHNITLNGRPINTTRSANANGVNTTLHPHHPNYTDYRTELVVNRELILLGFAQNGTGHVVVGTDISVRPNRNGRFNVSFMDPGTPTGDHTSTEMTPQGNVTLTDGSTANLDFMVTVSPR